MFRASKLKDNYPDSMTLEQSDAFEIYHTFEEEKYARRLAHKIAGVVYSQTGWHEPDETGETDRFERIDTADNLKYGLDNENGFYLVVKHCRTTSDKELIPPVKGCMCTTCEMNRCDPV